MAMQMKIFRTKSAQYLIGVNAPFLYTVQFLHCNSTRNFFS